MEYMSGQARCEIEKRDERIEALEARVARVEERLGDIEGRPRDGDALDELDARIEMIEGCLGGKAPGKLSLRQIQQWVWMRLCWAVDHPGVDAEIKNLARAIIDMAEGDEATRRLNDPEQVPRPYREAREEFDLIRD